MMHALARLIAAGPGQAVLVIALCTALSFLAPPLTSILAYGGAAALALYSLHAGARAGAVALLGAAAVTGVLTQLLLHQGLAVVVTSLLLWIPVWLAAVVLRGTGSLAMAMLTLTGLALSLVTLIFLLLGDPGPWWVARLGSLADAVAAQPELGIDRTALAQFIETVAPLMTGTMAAGLSFAALTCVILGRWWQALLVNPGGLRKDFYALRLGRVVSLVGIAMVAVATLKVGVLSSLALQWSLIAMVPFLFVGLAVMHASLANLKAAKGWLIALYVLMSLLPQVLLMVVLVGVLDPWLELRRRTERAETN
ncbi:MAG: hypothetical protein JSU62_12195 [Gammaproteobacteria bacterium]|nr:MAG: hypothetical protein JSU62_12195 [Gammaproteobacteria bacterium]